MMANPNNNKNFNDEALRINRELKRENDRLKRENDELWEQVKALGKARETIRIPISEHDFEHEVKNLVFNNEEFQWGAFHTVETERAIDVEFIPEVDDYERGEDNE